MRDLYFAWVKSKVGIGEETVEPPAGVTTVGELLNWLRRRSRRACRGAGRSQGDPRRRQPGICRHQSSGAADDEVALFPPVTGG